MCRYIFGLALAGALTATPSFGQNLITNPDFDVDALNWFHDTSNNQQLGTADANNCPDSGSLTANGVNTSQDFYYFSIRPTDCVEVAPGDTLFSSLWYRYQGTGFVRLYYNVCTDSVCSSCGGSSAILDFDATSPAWTQLEAQWQVPAGVGAVYLAVDATSTVPFMVELDRVYLGRSARIHDDGFEGATTCRWSLAVP